MLLASATWPRIPTRTGRRLRRQGRRRSDPEKAARRQPRRPAWAHAAPSRQAFELTGRAYHQKAWPGMKNPGNVELTAQDKLELKEK